ncbi:MAG: hypothetical protein HN653_07055, partial [Candidatus Marinimicrobia bacterium]|nr:hypothetical protein [Candidatus Neomarinimicrobiota bacterium]
MKLYIPLLFILFFGGCTSLVNKATGPVKLSERNRVLGDLLPERICYDVQYYDI